MRILGTFFEVNTYFNQRYNRCEYKIWMKRKAENDTYTQYAYCVFLFVSLFWSAVKLNKCLPNIFRCHQKYTRFSWKHKLLLLTFFLTLFFIRRYHNLNENSKTLYAFSHIFLNKTFKLKPYVGDGLINGIHYLNTLVTYAPSIKRAFKMLRFYFISFHLENFNNCIN